MAIVNEEALKNVIKTDKSNIFVLFGEDGYLKKLYVEKIIDYLLADVLLCNCYHLGANRNDVRPTGNDVCAKRITTGKKPTTANQ